MTAIENHARSIFLAALDREPDQWPALLDEVCGDNPELRARVDQLLHAHQAMGSIHGDVAAAQFPSPLRRDGSEPRPLGSGQGMATLDEPITERPGTVIGPYKLLEQIGEGGMGLVYVAEQQHPVKRRVALKIIKPGMDSRQVVARFEAERQALAMMDHPNIAKVFDGGTIGSEPRALASGSPPPVAYAPGSERPYFVMELVKGATITDYCDTNRRTTSERLELFLDVCHAVQHAHQKGIIHRDLKPSNVLVTVHDVSPVVKVIDFGIAKATGGQLTDKTLYTQIAHLVGTPMYMSPEQAGLSGLDVDTRSDVYSLGVLLYELLTGTTPFDSETLKKAGYDEMRRIIREEEPAKPSTRISTVGQAATTASDWAAKRQSDPHRLSQLFRRELDWIVMKALEKDRNRRYESASAFAADVQHYLNDEAVLACPPTAMYRFRKFARRNKRAMAMASVVGLAVLLAVAVLATSAVLIGREQQATQTAEQAKARAEVDRQKADERERREAYFHRITLANRDLGVELLAECPEDLRGWEWHYLKRLCRVEPLILRDKTEVNGVAFSPHGERLASAGGDGAVRIWNSRTGKVVQTLLAHTDSVLSVAFHPDGKHVASAGADRTVKVWDLTTGQEVFTEKCDAMRKHGSAYTVAFRPPDGRQLAAGRDGAVRVWDWQTRQLLHTFPGHEHHSISVAFSRDGRRLATGAFREGVRVWDAETGGLLQTIPAHRHPLSALAFSADGGRLASASFDHSVKVWDTTTGELLHTMLHTGNVDCVAFSPDGRRLASGGEDKTVRIWDTTTGREVLGLRGHTDMCACVAFSPDGWRVASSSTDGTIRFGNATPLRVDEGHQETLTFTGHGDEIRSVAFSPDGQRIASAGLDARVKVWDAATGQVSVEFSGHRDVVFCVAWHPDGQRIATAGAAGSDGRLQTLKVWDARNGGDIFGLTAAQEHFARPFQAVAFSPDRRYLVTGQGNGAVQVWDAKTGREVRTLGTHHREIRGVAFSRDSRHLATASSDGIVKLWDATHLDQEQEARPTIRARVPGPSLNVDFSPDGRRLATGGEDNTVKIWDVQDGRELQTLRGHNGEVYTVAFSPDDEGRWVASGGEDSTVKVWDSHTGKLVRTFRGHTGLVISLAFSPDGRRLVSGSRDTTVKVWDLTPLSKVPER